MQINSIPDPVQLPPFDVDAYLASPPSTGEVPAFDPHFFDSTGWSVVPATVCDEKGFTIQDYEVAAEEFNMSDEPDAKELGIQAIRKAYAMRKWLMHARSGGKN